MLASLVGIEPVLTDHFNGFSGLTTSYFFTILEEMGAHARLAHVELMVMLAIIRLDEPAYGVPIARDIEAQSGREVAVGSVYNTLERLEAKGFVSSTLGEPTAERGGRAKRFFRVTAKGLQAVRDAQRVSTTLWRGVPKLKKGLA